MNLLLNLFTVNKVVLEEEVNKVVLDEGVNKVEEKGNNDIYIATYIIIA